MLQSGHTPNWLQQLLFPAQRINAEVAVTMESDANTN